ncbi:MAG: Hsp20/alpha crystallin family protein [Halanaerobiales bacterium]
MFDLVPFRRNRNQVQRRSEDPFDSFFSNFFDMVDRSNMGFRTDVKETEDEYILEAELPGLEKDDINIEIEEDYLTISADKEETTEERGEDYLRRERKTGRYSRTFALDNVRDDEIKASYDNGVLELVLPKKEPGKPRRRTIDIE